MDMLHHNAVGEAIFAKPGLLLLEPEVEPRQWDHLHAALKPVDGVLSVQEQAVGCITTFMTTYTSC